MKSIIFFGPPGVGKGTQCGLLSSRLGFAHLSTGGILRQEIASGSHLGLSVKAKVEAGLFVEDDVILGCFENVLSVQQSLSKAPVLIDGIPRNLNQAYLIDNLLLRVGCSLDAVIFIDANLESLMERFRKRWTCGQCNHVTSFEAEQKESAMQCSVCGFVGTFYRRKDDASETVQKRFDIYREQTKPLVTHYAEKAFHVDGLQDTEFVYSQVVSHLVQKKVI